LAGVKALRVAVALALIALIQESAAAAAQTSREQGTLSGLVTTLGGGTSLPGATIDVRTEAGVVVAQAVSDEHGRFAIAVPPGQWTVVASLTGFAASTKSRVAVTAAGETKIDFDLTVGGVEERVDVVAQRPGEAPLEIPSTSASVQVQKGALVDELPVQGESFEALLPLLPGVVRGPDGRLNVNGGAESQTALLVNNVSLNDPATGEFGATLPVDAVDSVTLLPNPYAAEYGRFTAGVSQVATKSGSNDWKLRVNNFVPKFRWRDGTLKGLEKFTPRVAVGGPLVRDKLFFAQSFRYRVVNTKVPARPTIDNDNHIESFDSFTQLDANLGSRHSMTGTVSFFPRDIDQVTVDTFTPREVSPSFRQRGYSVALAERATLSSTALLESVVAVKTFNAQIDGQDDGTMVLSPDENGGSFFNEQSRETHTLQAGQTLTFHPRSWAGSHDLKAGVDVIRATLDGSGLSRDVEVRRRDGTVSQRLTFGRLRHQHADRTDVGAFLQDRWRVTNGLLFEVGGRLDWDGVRDRLNLAPRAGFSANLGASGRSAVRGGAGLFFSETPLNVLAFESFETPTVTYFAADGVTPLRVVPFAHRLKGMNSPASLIWNLEYDRKVGDHLLFKVNHLRRNGRHEYLVEPVESGGAGMLEVDSVGRTRYWELELTSRVVAAGQQLYVTYVRSDATSDLNRFDRFFGNFRNPVVRPNEFSRADTDTPNRLLVRGSLTLRGWMVSPLLEFRDGFPYSVVDEDRDFVGARNRGGRFPLFKTLDLDVQRRIAVFGLKPRVGLRVFHLLGDFLPRDVQANIAAARFGQFSNTIERQFGLTLQFD
jgi:hypothetical protein